MKKGRIWLLLSFAAVVVMVFFLLSDLRSPKSPSDPSKDGSSKKIATAKHGLTNLRAASGRQEMEQNPGSSTGRSPATIPTLDQRVEDEGDYDEEEAEAKEEAQKTEAEYDNDGEEEEEEGLIPEQEEALGRLLAEITPESWRQVRTELLSAYKDGTLPRNSYVENEFWSKVGEVGGRKVADELLNDSDPAYNDILAGWGKADPQALFDYFSELDLKDPKIQNYLDQTNNRELPFFDQFSSGILDGLVEGNDSGRIDDVQMDEINEIIDHFLKKDPMKGESLMREFSERVIEDRDLDSLKEWVFGYDEPRLQAATAQRVIESGAFDGEPLEAVKFANSLSFENAKRSGLSSAYARLAGGVNGHNPDLTAKELNNMQNGMDRDSALNGFAHGLVHSDPERALQWANSISNENFRKIVTKNISKRIKVELPDASVGQE